ncbi:MAG: hypothetical protein J1F23_01345 [Oscillospiraceae bacterium]|nr:hypothetical protein [Oscillospiraceae bacterium]
MKEYVPPKMEIDLFENNGEMLTVSSGSGCGCDVPDCPINFAYGGGTDPWDSFSWWN